MNGAGVAQLAPDSRGGYFDARKLAVLELLTGREFRQGNEPNPNRNSAAVLELEFKKFYRLCTCANRIKNNI